jgi:hypothetical protein
MANRMRFNPEDLKKPLGCAAEDIRPHAPLKFVKCPHCKGTGWLIYEDKLEEVKQKQ